MKVMILALMSLISASALADYVPTITCSIEAHQKTETGEAFYSTHGLMYWSPDNPNGEKVLDYRFYRLDLLPDQIKFKMVDDSSVTIKTLKKGESMLLSRPNGETIRIWCE